MMESLDQHIATLFADEPATPATAAAKAEAKARLTRLFERAVADGETATAATQRAVAQTPTLASLVPAYSRPRPAIGLDVPTVSAYWARRGAYARGLAVGVGLLVAAIGVIPGILMLNLPGGGGFAAIGFFGMIAAGVVTLVRHVGVFSDLQRKVRHARLSLAAKREAQRRADAYRPPFTYALCGGIGLIFLSLIAPILCISAGAEPLGATLFFAFNALGIATIVYTSTIRNGYHQLFH